LAAELQLIKNDPDDRGSTSIADEVKDRLSSELIFALVGPVASGVSTVAKILSQKLRSDYKYDVPEIIKVSDFIKKFSDKVASNVTDASLVERISSYQEVGTSLRGKLGSAFLAKLAIKRISEIRHADGYKKIATDAGEADVPVSKRRVYIIDSLKNPEEINQLREIYGNIFWLIGVSSADYIRSSRLEVLGADKSKIYSILNRDMGERAEFGQKVRKAFSSSDFFIRNDSENTELLARSVDRFLDVIFGVSVNSPTTEESAMFHAATAASKSACLSRQVGASLINKEGDLISVGWNDVPRFGGGLYPDEAGQVQEARCFHWREKVCHNDGEKSLIAGRIIAGIKSAQIKKHLEALKGNKKAVPIVLSDQEISEAIESSGVSSLIEFSRAIHAEMACILAVARDKRHSLKGATMVVTTYPCHNCARHIVASGVHRVLYLEPYEKSLAIKLHPDAVSEDIREVNKVHFIQFQGFAPRHILDLFSVKQDRKRGGALVVREKCDALPVYRRHLDSFTLYEDKVVYDIDSMVRN